MSIIDPKKLVKTCSACPSQWEGQTEDGRAVYVRYRHDHLSVSISYIKSNQVEDALNGEKILEVSSLTGDGWNGVLSLNELNAILAKNGLSADPGYEDDTDQGPQFTLENFENVVEVFANTRKKND